ncbi:alkyl hydroperoxide reductase subunit F [Swingsia samuiensis]|uniref:Thioredoxin reductase n=1 Tax=Swingsia samuiensis TaxID=1293412 RepID=A0A4Y6UGJ9_9PROT|nr:alkyl hydroperoxide reductase subunit F [Swingsia samuiensis]QDH16689.1 alkyl hydroperoxide reductase subunit F [Swingsia samuiensis]
MLQDDLKSQMRAYMQYLRNDVVLQASLGSDARSKEMRDLLEDIASLSDKVTFSDAGQSDRRPSFTIRRAGSSEEVSFAGIPMGHEFTSLVLALLQVSGHPPKVDEDIIEQIKALKGDLKFETYFSQSCQNCPDVVQALNTISVLNPNIKHTAIDGADFQAEVEKLGIRSVPQVYLNGEPFSSGRLDIAGILGKLDTSSVEKAAEKLNDTAPFEVLVLGAGPAGATAAIYAARKGLRTGLIADRFGGQVMDTAGIENFISVKETDGPKLSAELEAHVRQYDVQIISGQRAAQLVPAERTGGLHEIVLESGAKLRSKTVILATGASWRQLSVPGEDDYRTKGVAYCPHCDGPFYKGRPVVITGGGNSGVEAAIDLANIVSHVTLLQRGPRLKADKVLQDKLLSLPNVTVHTNALTTHIEGNGEEVTCLVYKDEHGEEKRINTDGVFVQIGLIPNTEWLKGALDLSSHGEIIVDDHGATSVPGVFAAGDATTVPYKQIVIAMGEGAKASLAAFDYMIRLPVEA